MAINNLLVIKAGGGKEKFQREKVFRTCLRSGAGRGEAEKIVKEVERKIYDGITTREILKIVLDNLEKINFRSANVYNLKEAIMRLGPPGFIFEEFMTRLLSSYNLKTERPLFISGKCINHEIDIVARGGNGRDVVYIIECKYHNVAGIYCGAKEVLYTWARFEDLNEGYQASKRNEAPRNEKTKYQKFDIPWLITNTKFSEGAICYAQCKKMRLLGWKYPEEASLENLIEKKKFYPITILRHLDDETKNKLFKNKIIFCEDLLKYDLSSLARLGRIKKNKAKSLINLVGLIIK